MHDSHVHLSLSPLRENLDRILPEFKEDNGKYILDMGTEPEDWLAVYRFTKKTNLFQLHIFWNRDTANNIF